MREGAGTRRNSDLGVECDWNGNAGGWRAKQKVYRTPRYPRGLPEQQQKRRMQLPAEVKAPRVLRCPAFLPARSLTIISREGFGARNAADWDRAKACTLFPTSEQQDPASGRRLPEG